MATDIHPSSLIAAKATIEEDCRIGPFCYVGDGVHLGKNTTLISHVVIDGDTTVGTNSTIYPFASIGLIPQDLKYNGEKTTLIIGEHTIIREHVTMNPGTQGGGGQTIIGDYCLFMVGSHVAHDCRVGNHAILANNATLGGHVHVGDYAILGGLSAVHQFVRIGHHTMISGTTGIRNDVIPYGSVMPMGKNGGYLSGLNIIGLKRRGFDRSTIHQLRQAYRLLFAQEGALLKRVEDVAKLFPAVEPVMEIVAFIRSADNRGICQPSANAS